MNVIENLKKSFMSKLKSSKAHKSLQKLIKALQKLIKALLKAHQSFETIFFKPIHFKFILR
jgi:transposase